MRLRQIEVFHAVYASGTVTAAAERLNVSQPSVSKVLAHAEMQLGFRLFDRVRGKLRPTPEADLLFLHASTLHQHLDDLRSVAENIRTAEDGGVRIASTPAFGIDVLPSAIARYREEHEGIVFWVETLHYEEICKALLETRIDVGLVFEPVAHPDIRQDFLLEAQFVALTPAEKALVAGRPVRLEDLASRPFITLDSKGPLGRMLADYVQSSPANLEVAAHAQTYQVAKALVAYGAGVTITDEITARSSGHGDININPLDPPLSFRIAAVSLEARPLSLVCARFVNHLERELRKFLLSGREMFNL